MVTKNISKSFYNKSVAEGLSIVGYTEVISVVIL